MLVSGSAAPARRSEQPQLGVSKVPLVETTTAVLTANGLLVALSLALLIALSLSLLQRPDFRLLRRMRPPEQQTEEGERIVVFYHVHAINNWRDILRDQITKLIYSGLYEAATAISAYCGVSGDSKKDISAAVEFMRQYGSKFKVVEERVNTTLAERLTLNRVKELTRPTDRIFYLHSKGVSKKHRERWRKDTIWAWRDSMEFFLIRHYRQCLPILREYDLVGINWIKEGDNRPLDDPHNRGVNTVEGYPAHFSGNFWWTTGAFWHRLPDGFMGSDYSAAENDMFRYNPRVACVQYDGLEGMGHYYYFLPPKNYTDIATLSVVAHS